MLHSNVDKLLFEMSYWGHKKQFAKSFTKNLMSLCEVVAQVCKATLQQNGPWADLAFWGQPQ